MATKKTAGKKLIRSLDTTGFYTDYDRAGSLFAALIRSPAPAGKVLNISIPDLPADYVLYTAKDIPGDKILKIGDFESKIFGFDDISYAGEPLGILIGPDESVITELLEKVSIDLDVKNLESALHNVITNQNKQEEAENFTEVLEQINDMPSLDTVISESGIEENPNITLASREVKYGLYQNKSVAEADKELFNDKSLITSNTWKQSLESPKWKETEGAFAYMEGSNLHIYVPTKWTSLTQKLLSQVLSIKIENIYIHKTKVSGTYPTGLWRTSIIAAQTALAAYLSKKPIKLVLTQKEQDYYLKPGVQTQIKYQSALDDQGHLSALKVLIDIDVGCGNPFVQEITDRITIAACNFYKPKNLYIHTNTHTSKNPPTTISLKVVDSQSFFAIENEIQKICNITQQLPDEVRLLNCQQDKKNKAQEFPFEIEAENFDKLLESVIKNADFNRKYASFHMEAIDRTEKDSKPFFALPLRGIGLASGYVVSGYKGSTAFPYDQKIEVTLNTDDKLVIHSPKPSDVIQEIWKKTATEILQIQKQNVIINSDFNIDELPENPEELNSSIGVMNELIKKCCQEIQKKRFHQALPITSKKSLPRSTKAKWDKENFTGDPFITKSTAATIVEVQLDTYTYSEKINGIWMAVDCGEIFDEAAAIRTIKLEIQQELGMLVKGKTVSCDSIKINFINSNNKSGQIGGLVHNTLPAAFASALSLALTKQVTELPCTESQLFQLIKDRTNNQQGENK